MMAAFALNKEAGRTVRYSSFATFYGRRSPRLLCWDQHRHYAVVAGDNHGERAFGGGVLRAGGDFAIGQGSADLTSASLR
jgi:hypothetical protein